MAKLLEGIIDGLLPGLAAGSSDNFFGNPFRAPWGDDPQPPAPISDADGTRGDERKLPTGIVNRPPIWWGPFPYPPPSDIPVPVTPSPNDPAGDGFEPVRPPTIRPPAQSSETYQQGRDRQDRARAGSRNNQRNELRERLLDEERAKEQQEDFLKKRRAREQQWRESKEANDIPMPPRGVLLPIEDDWTVDLGEDPNETDEERNARRRRSDWIRRGQQAGITAIGGVTSGAIYNTWKDRSKWVLKNSGTIQGRKYPLPPSIPSSGGQGDLDPSQDPPVDPPRPAQPNARLPIERTASSWIKPIGNYQRAIPVQNIDDAMDCSC